MIVCIDFKAGLFINPSEDILKQVKIALGDTTRYSTRLLVPGSHNLTPREWDDPNYDYWVNVGVDGLGTMRMVPRVEGAASKFTNEVRWREGVREQPINSGAVPIIILGGSKASPTGLAVYKIVGWMS